MATRGEAIEEIAGRLGNRTDLNTRILRTMGYVQRHVCEMYPILPWFLITENLYRDTVSGEPLLPLPDNFLREVETGALWRQRTPDAEDGRKWVEMTKKPLDSLKSELGDQLALTGEPNFYAIMGSYWVLFPTPDDEYRIYTRVYQQDALPINLVDDDETNQWLTHGYEILVAETVLRLGRHLRFPDSAMSEFRADRNEARRNFFITIEAREHANLRYRMGIARGN